MKKIILIALLSLCLWGCQKQQIVVYQDLPNQYELWKTGKNKYELGKKEGEKLQLEVNKIAIGVQGNITSFSIYENRYIALKAEEKTMLYYVIDTKEKEVFGPLNNEEELDYKLNALGITKPGEWIVTETLTTK